MNQPYQPPHPNAPPPHSPSIFPYQHPPYQHADPAQTVSQQRQEQQLQENISPQSHPSAHQNHRRNGILSEEQRAAALTFQAIPDPNSYGLLEDFRSFSQRSLASAENFNDSSTLGNGGVDFWTQSPSFVNNASTLNVLNSPSVQDSYNLSRDSSVGLSNSSAASSNEHDRWCFFCENPKRPFRTADGFKRHLREQHMRQYSCVPQAPLVYKEDGPRCAFCNIPNPDPVHLNTHASECDGKRFSRKYLLIDHLKNEHGVPDVSELAGQFEYTVDQKYFACGFCVFCCGSLNGLANHVDDHYKSSQHIRDWDHDKVIRGLLSQPDVIECWQAFLASILPLQESQLRWMPELVEQLEYRLEMNWEPAETLCNAAMYASNYRWDGYGYPEPVPADQGMIANQTIEPLERQDVISPLPFSSVQSHIDYLPHTVAASPQLQHPTEDWIRPNIMHFDDGRSYPQVTSMTYGSPGNPVYRHPSPRAQLSHPLSRGESFMQGQYPAYSSSPTSASGTLRAPEGQARNPYYPRLGGHSSDLSRNLAINQQSRHEVETYVCPAQAHAGYNYPASTMESVSSPLSPDHSISPLSYFNHSRNPRAHPPVAAHSSHREPTHRRGTDMDSHSDERQRFTHARDRSRRQRRDH